MKSCIRAIFLIAYLLAFRAFSFQFEVNQLYDSREYMISKVYASKTWGETSLWGFLEQFYNIEQFNDDSGDYTNFAELRLTQKLSRNFAVQLEYNDVPGAGNDVLRVGGVISLDMPGVSFFNLRLFPYETGRDFYQLSLIASCRLVSRRLYLTFIGDCDFYRDTQRWFIEPFITYKITGNIGVLMRYTYTDYIFDKPVVRRNGASLGLSYRF